MNKIERERIRNLPDVPTDDDVKWKFNGVVHLVKHTDLTRQWIGRGDTLEEAWNDAQKVREKVISNAKDEEAK